jgi:L-galactose dehydrogenase
MAPSMARARLGRTNLDVSVASIGTGGFSRLGQEYGGTPAESVRVLRAAMDAGIDFIDTAADYRTEEIVAQAVAGRRDSVVISTKNQVYRRSAEPTGDELITAGEFRELLDGNLRRLGTDYIDVFHLHGVCPNQYRQCVDAFVPEMIRMREQGKIRFLAISERFFVDPGHEMLQLALRDDVFDVMMVGFNFVNQTALTRILPDTTAKDIGTQCMYAVRRRLATPERAQALIDELAASGEVDPADLDPVRPLGFLLDDPSVRSLADACYRFNRHAPGADVILTSTGRVEHLRDNVASINSGPLPGPVLERLHKIFGRVESVTAE